MFAFTKDVRAFLNYVSDEWAPEEWPNPVRRIKCKRPQVFIRPLSREQLLRLFELAETAASSELVASRNRAMLVAFIDGALRVGELLSACKNDLSLDGLLVANPVIGMRRWIGACFEAKTKLPPGRAAALFFRGLTGSRSIN